MTLKNIPEDWPVERYCGNCGCELGIARQEELHEGYQLVLRCSECGHAFALGLWSPAPGVIIHEDGTTEYKFHGDSDAQLGTVKFEGPTEPEEPEIPDWGKIQRGSRKITDEFIDIGLRALFDAAKFPVYAVKGHRPELRLRSLSFGSSGTEDAPLGSIKFLHYDEGMFALQVDCKFQDRMQGRKSMLTNAFMIARYVKAGLRMSQASVDPGEFARAISTQSLRVVEPTERQTAVATWSVYSIPGPVEAWHAYADAAPTSVVSCCVGELPADFQDILLSIEQVEPGGEFEERLAQEYENRNQH